MNPHISIIVPVYNTQHYLSKCIDSILTQSFSNFELLLVDDGSTDGSGAICDDYARIDSRIRVLHRSNKGISSTRNVGLDYATGEWITFVDSDDILLPNALGAMTNLTTDNIEIVIAGYAEINNDFFYKSPGNYTPQVIDNNEALLYMYPSANKPYLGYSWSKLFKKKTIDSFNIRFDETILFKEDTLFVVDFICHMSKKAILYLSPVYGYRVNREGSEMTSMTYSYSIKYFTSFDSVVKMRQLISGLNNTSKQLLRIAKYEIVNRYYLIYGHMLDHNALDRKRLSSIKLQAIREVGILFYIVFQYNRYLRKIKTHYNRALRNV